MSTTPTPAHTPPAPRRLTLRRESLRDLTADTLRHIAGGGRGLDTNVHCSSDATVKHDVKILAA